MPSKNGSPNQQLYLPKKKIKPRKQFRSLEPLPQSYGVLPSALPGLILGQDESHPDQFNPHKGSSSLIIKDIFNKEKDLPQIGGNQVHELKPIFAKISSK